MDDKIELNRRMNATLESMARALFQSWFIDFDPVRAKLDNRHPTGMDAETAALFPDKFEHQDGELIPYRWRLITTEEILSPDRGISVGVMYPGDHDPCGVPLIKAGDLSGGIINRNPQFRVSHQKHEEYRRTEFSGGEILMTLVGNIGQCAVVPPEMKGWNSARAVAVIRLADPTNASYVRLWLESEPIQFLMHAWSNTTVQETLNLKEIRKLPLLWPPQDVLAAPYCIPNELICGELGRFLRLPVPPFGIVSQKSGGPRFASLDFNLAGNSLPPVDISNCLRDLPSLSAGLLLFDIWVANCDRHMANFSVDFLAVPPQMNIFDHSHALFGYAVGQGQARLSVLRDRLGTSWTTNNPVDSGRHRHCLLDTMDVDTHFKYWLDRIQTTPDFFIEEICKDAQPYGLTLAEVTAAIGFLKHRRDNLLNIINSHRAEFSAIRVWSLPL